MDITCFAIQTAWGYTNNGPRVVHRSLTTGLSLSLRSHPRWGGGLGPLTDIEALRPHVETHLRIREGAVARQPTGGGFFCARTERKGKEEQKSKSITATFKTRQNFLSAHTLLAYLSPHPLSQDEPIQCKKTNKSVSLD